MVGSRTTAESVISRSGMFDQRDSGGYLLIQYNIVGSSKQKAIIAKKVNLSLLPLMRTGVKNLFPVKGN